MKSYDQANIQRLLKLYKQADDEGNIPRQNNLFDLIRTYVDDWVEYKAKKPNKQKKK